MSVKTIIAETKKGKGQVTQFLEKENEEAEQEYANTKLKRLIAEEKARINELGAEGKKPEAHVSSDLLGHIMDLAQVNPVKAKEFLTSLNEDDLGKLAVISSMGQNGGMNNLLPMLKGGSNMQDIIAIVKLLQDNRQPKESGMDLKGIAEIFKAGVEASKAQQPANPQGDLQYKILENSMAEIRAMREERTREDRLRTEKEIADLKARPSGFDELVYNEEKAAKVRKIFGGADSGAANEFTLRKAEMDQTERLETRKLDWEEKKWEKEKDKEGNVLETVKEILAGPAGEILKNFGSAGADRIRGNKASPPSGQAQSPQIAQISCPKCAGTFSVNTQLPTIQCPLCGVQLQNGNQPAQSQDMPKDQSPSNSTQAQSSPIPAQEKPADQTVEVESPVEQIATKE